MTDSQSSYRQVLKAISIFGSVQFFTILISIVKSKVISIIIGSTGLGIFSLLTTTLTLLGSITSIGLETSGVKSIASFQNDSEKLVREVNIINRLIWITSIIGAILVAIASPFLSKISFGNSHYTIAFLILSISFFFKQLTNGEIIILQGLHKIKNLAKTNLYSNVFGLLVSLPLYYFFKIDGIVFSIILSSIIGYFVARFYSKEFNFKKLNLTNNVVFEEGKNTMILGFSLSLIGLLTTLSAYLLQIFISNVSSISQVGFYSAGITILNTYVGVIFTAMATDYFPRLSKINNNNEQIKIIANQQVIIALLLLTPIIVVFLIFAPHLIQLLYSKDFLIIVPFVVFGIMGMVFKAVSWSLGYIIIAKGESKLFIKTSFFFNSFFLIINAIGYYYYGLIGLGVTYILNHLLHLVVVKIIVSYKYNFKFAKEFYGLFLISIGFCLLTYYSLKISESYIKYSFISLILVCTIYFSFFQLNKKVGFKDLLNKYKDDERNI